jgi:hypothetical protein
VNSNNLRRSPRGREEGKKKQKKSIGSANLPKNKKNKDRNKS